MPREYRINRQIQAPQVRVVDGAGNQLGIMPIEEARRAANERELDLVEVAPAANPPVCRLLDYGKFRLIRRESQPREARPRAHISQPDREAQPQEIRTMLEEISRSIRDLARSLKFSTWVLLGIVALGIVAIGVLIALK